MSDKKMDVSFDFRFSRDRQENKVEADVRSALIEGCLKANAGVKKASVYPVERMGRSTATVFYVDAFCEKNINKGSYVAKFDENKAISGEVDAVESASRDGLIQESPLRGHQIGDKLSAILYTYSSGKEFRYWFLDKTKDYRFVKRVVDHIYGSTVKHSPAGDRSSSMWSEEYAWYINRKVKPVEHLKAFCKSEHPLSSHALKVFEGFSKISGSPLEFQPVCIHGDLHARNVMVEETSTSVRASLIDFHWAKPGHIFKDYVLLELTIKLALFLESINGVIKECPPGEAEFINAEIIRKLESIYRHAWENEYDALEVIMLREFPELRGGSLDTYKKVVGGVGSIRRAALSNSRSIIEDASDAKRQYLKAMLMVGVGLIGIGDYDSLLLLASLENALSELDACS